MHIYQSTVTEPMEPAEGEESSSATQDQSASPSRDQDPHAVVEEYRYLLDGVPHIDETPEELHLTVSEFLDLVSNSYSMAILYHLFCEQRPLRFNELEDATGASPKVLSQRLKEFAEVGLVARQSYDEIPPRVEYEPTPKAKALDPAFQFLYAWSARFDLG
jgi:DNA-binding HxlR family transcriptional regulator